MRLQSLRVQNFGIIREAYLEFPAEASVIYVRGVNRDAPHVSSNASGKSTILSALTWCLYECDAQGNKIAGESITDGAEYAEVGIVIEGEINAYIERKRTIAPINGSVIQLNVSYDSRQLCREEAQRWIDATFGNTTAFLASHIYAYDDGFTPYALASDKQQKSLFDKLLGFDDLEEACKHVTKTEGDLRQKTGRLERQLIRLTAMQSVLKKADSKEIGRLYNDLFTLGLEIGVSDDYEEDSLSQEVNAAWEAYKRAQTAYHEANDALVDFRSSLVPLEAVIEAQRAKVEAVKNRPECGVCGASLEGKDWRSLLGRTYVEYRENIAMRKDLLNNFGDYEEKQENVARLHTALTTAAANYKSAQDKLSKKKDEYHALEMKISEMGGFFSSDKGYSVYQIVNAVRDSIATHEAELAILSFWKEGFGRNGIRAYRLDQVTPRLNEVAAEYADRLFGDGTTVRYSTQTQLKSGEYRDRFSVELIKDARTITRHSAGQAARRDLIHLLTIATVANEINPTPLRFIALDEAFRTIDAAGVYSAVELLRALTPTFGTIIVVEHDNDLESMFDKCIEVTRENGMSTAKFIEE